MIRFIDKIGAAGVAGFFLSMSGFDRRAIQRAEEELGRKTILLMDGEELSTVVRQLVTFDALVAQKRAHFDFRDRVYHRVLRGIEQS
jgi:hypothetical protein